MRVRWTAWLRPRYVWMRVKMLFGWRPEWVRRIESQKLRPQVMLMDPQTFDMLLHGVRGMTTFHMTDEEFEKFGSDLRKYDFKPDWELKR